ncbi:MAG TPA: nucleoside 2-deoxyribosyltransferase [Candidatus Paceibacterota bacterium]|nr:nucleoside 2-deoxyribosyltransferase [Candidatus Paceibacterota bacterium]
MKYFISYRFTGEDPAVLKSDIEGIKNALVEAGHSSYASIEKQNTLRERSNREILEDSLQELRSAGAILVFKKSPEKSEGMLIEIGYALARKKKMVLAIQRNISTVFLREIADIVIDFENMDDLKKQLAQLK